jgi:Tfp pilus assembly protein PilF
MVFIGYNGIFMEVVTLKTIKIIILSLFVTGLLLANACSARSGPKTELEFANKLAQNDLWKEANFRWMKLLKQGKESAALYNNIAISFEEMGKFKEAEESYRKALKLSPNNSTIKNNYNNFKRMFKKDDDEKEKRDKKDKH